MSHPLAGLAERRKLQLISAAALADRVGIAVNSFGRLERGQRRCYLDKAIAIANMLGCTVEQLSQAPSLEEKIAALTADEQRRAQLTRVGGDEKVAAVLKGWGGDPEDTSIPVTEDGHVIGTVVSASDQDEGADEA